MRTGPLGGKEGPIFQGPLTARGESRGEIMGLVSGRKLEAEHIQREEGICWRPPWLRSRDYDDDCTPWNVDVCVGGGVILAETYRQVHTLTHIHCIQNNVTWANLEIHIILEQYLLFNKPSPPSFDYFYRKHDVFVEQCYRTFEQVWQKQFVMYYRTSLSPTICYQGTLLSVSRG